MSNTKTYLFTNKDGKTLQIGIGLPVPSGYRPFDQNILIVYSYYDMTTKKTSNYPATSYSPGYWILKGVSFTSPSVTSKGEAWDTGSNVLIVPSGVPVPATWTPVFNQPIDVSTTTTVDVSGVGDVLVDTSTQQNQDIPYGYVVYQSPNGGLQVVPQDKPVPSDWVLVNSNASPSVEIYQNDANGAEVVNDTDPNAFADPLIDLQIQPGPSPSNFWKIVGVVIGGAGVLGLGYLGYLAYTSPTQLAQVVENTAKAAGFVISVSQALVAVAVIGALSFVTWEFWKKMDENNGDVGKSIGSLLADGIEVFVTALVDAIEQLVKDAWNFVWGEIKSIWPF